MSADIAWDNAEKTIIKVTFDRQWEAGDMFRIIDEGTRMMLSVNHKVDSIFDFTNSSVSPSKLLSTVERMEETHSENERLMIIVKANSYIKSLARVAKLLAPKTFTNLYFVDLLPEAYTVIEEHHEHSFVR